MLIFRYQLHLKDGKVFSKPDIKWNFPNYCGTRGGDYIRNFRPPNLTSMYFNYKRVKDNSDGYGRCEILF